MPRKVSPDAIPTGRLGHTDGPDSRDGRSYTIILSILALFFAVFFFFYFPNEKHQTVQFTPIINDNDINPKMLDISHWELGKQIGKGGYSRVFLGRRKTIPGTNKLLPPPDSAESSSDKYDHAVKIIPKARYFRSALDPNSTKLQKLDKDSLLNAIWSERNAWVAFSNPKPIPFTLPLSHILQDSNALYYMVPLINGGDLDRSLNMFGPMNEHTVRYYAASIITALEGMHARGYVYKDIKLKNLLLDELGRLQITDFGLTRFAAKNPSNPSIPTNCVTNGVTGRAGTKSYKSPEVLTGSGHSYPSDFYALGVVLYKMLTGHKLYHSEHDLPKLSHFLRIPKYHHYVLKQPRWRAFGVYDLYTKVQQDFAANGFSESTYDVLDYSVQRDYLAFHLSAVLNSKFSEQGGQIAKDWKRSGGSNQTQDGETDEENGQNNDNGDNGDKKKFKKIQKKSPNSLLYPYKPEELFVDGVGPIFSPDESIKHQEDIANGKLSNSKGKVNGKLAWLSLSDDAVDFLTQMTELNPFYRLGTPNRYYRDYNPDIYHGEEDKQTVSVEQPQTGSIVELNTHKEHWLDSFSQDFSHTQAALLSSQRFDYLSDVVGIANMEEIEWREENGEFLESIIKKNNGGDKSSIKNNTKNDGEYDTKNYDGKNQPKATPHKHCFVQFIDVNKELPSFRGKDKDGKWKGLHNGFVELKNHPWFKNFDWDLMTESSIVFNTNNQQNGQSGQNDQNGRNLKNDTFIPGHEKIQFASVDVKNYQQRFPEMIDAKDDHFDQKWQSLFEGLDFNTTI